MSSKKYAAPLRLELRRSAYLAGLLSATHGLALIALFLTELEGAWLTLLAVFVMMSAVYAIYRHALLAGRDAIVKIEWGEDGVWRLATRAEDAFEAFLAADTYLHPHLIILNFYRSNGLQALRSLLFAHGFRRRNSVVILPDRLDQMSFRRLYVRLNIEGRKQAPEVF